MLSLVILPVCFWLTGDTLRIIYSGKNPPVSDNYFFIWKPYQKESGTLPNYLFNYQSTILTWMTRIN